mmetsp:Transcript_53360/g.113987  ORF Transcript_53360/g.113987 Transcript_53360/m.113987 type:complete len:182 (-) Transcript_53360:377-922(-)
MFSDDTVPVNSGEFAAAQNIVGIHYEMQTKYATFFGWQYTYPIHLSAPFTPITPSYVCAAWLASAAAKLRSWIEPTGNYCAVAPAYGEPLGSTARYENVKDPNGADSFWLNGNWQTYALHDLDTAKTSVGTYVAGGFTSGTHGFDCTAQYSNSRASQTAACTTLFASLRHLSPPLTASLRC